MCQDVIVPADRASRIPGSTLPAQVDAVMSASRVLVALSARAMVQVDPSLTPIQLRALVVLRSRGSVGLTELADALRVHPSNATRACDKLVAADLVYRRDNPENRRALLLELSPTGKQVIRSIESYRRQGVIEVLRRLTPERRTQVAAAMGEFAAAGGEPVEGHLWTMGWSS